MTRRRRTLLGCAALARVALADLVVVPYNDPAITYTGVGWHLDIMEIRPGLDPATNGGGPNSSVCELGQESWTTNDEGATFSFVFTGVGVQLIMETRQDHGFFGVSIDGATPTTVEGYSDSPNCGALYNKTGLPQGTHTVSATLQAHDPASTWPAFYIQLFSIIYDTGAPVSQPQNSTIGPVTTTTASSPIPAGAIAGAAIGSLVVGFLVALGIVLLLARRKREPSSKLQPESVELTPYFPRSAPTTTAPSSSPPPSTAPAAAPAHVPQGTVEPFYVPIDAGRAPLSGKAAMMAAQYGGTGVTSGGGHSPSSPGASFVPPDARAPPSSGSGGSGTDRLSEGDVDRVAARLAQIVNNRGSAPQGEASPADLAQVVREYARTGAPPAY